MLPLRHTNTYATIVPRFARRERRSYGVGVRSGRVSGMGVRVAVAIGVDGEAPGVAVTAGAIVGVGVLAATGDGVAVAVGEDVVTAVSVATGMMAGT